MVFGPITRMVHNILAMEMKKVLDSSHKVIAVDCTMGNGNDTLFLSKLVGHKGEVFAFDIQEEALETTQKLVNEHSVENVKLIKRGHQHVNEYVSAIDVCMFNLGYLPKGDHELVTQSSTTLQALGKTVGMLKRKGIISIISYYGHEGGLEEKDAVNEFVSALDHKIYEVTQLSKSNRQNYPPIVTFIRKI